MISRRAFLCTSAAALASGPARAGSAPALAELVFDPDLPPVGNPDGDITIAEFFDYVCPSCRAIHPHLKKIVEDDGGIRLVMKDWPINGDVARYASRMVLAAARIGLFGKAHAAVMAIEGRLSMRRIDDAMRGKGIDVGTVRDALDVHLAAIDALFERNEAQARALSLPGTPAFIVGRTVYRRPLNQDEIRQAVRDARYGG